MAIKSVKGITIPKHQMFTIMRSPVLPYVTRFTIIHSFNHNLLQGGLTTVYEHHQYHRDGDHGDHHDKVNGVHLPLSLRAI